MTAITGTELDLARWVRLRRGASARGEETGRPNCGAASYRLKRPGSDRRVLQLPFGAAPSAEPHASRYPASSINIAAAMTIPIAATVHRMVESFSVRPSRAAPYPPAIAPTPTITAAAQTTSPMMMK